MRPPDSGWDQFKSVSSMRPASSGTILACVTSRVQLESTSSCSLRHFSTSGPDKSSYSPAEARSLTVRMPTFKLTRGPGRTFVVHGARDSGVGVSASRGVSSIGQQTLECPAVLLSSPGLLLAGCFVDNVGVGKGSVGGVVSAWRCLFALKSSICS